MKKITPIQVRKDVKKGIAKMQLTPAEFYRKYFAVLDLKVKQRTFEMFVSSKDMTGMACLVPVWEMLNKGKHIIKNGVSGKGVTWFVSDKTPEPENAQSIN